MRILFLAPQPFFEVRGTPLAVLHLVGALAAVGHEVDLLTFPQGQPHPIEGVRHLRSLALPVGRVKAGPSFAKMVLQKTGTFRLFPNQQPKERNLDQNLESLLLHVAWLEDEEGR